MNTQYPTENELIQLANNTTLGKKSIELINTPKPRYKPLIICFVLLGIGIPIASSSQTISLAELLFVCSACFGVYWIYKQSVYKYKMHQYNWILWLFTGVGMIFNANIKGAIDHFGQKNVNKAGCIHPLRQTCIEMISQRIRSCNCQCAVLQNLWALLSLVTVNEVLTALGDNSLSGIANGSYKLLDDLNTYAMNGNRIADSIHYGQARMDYIKTVTASGSTDLLQRINLLEAQQANTLNDPYAIAQLDATCILDTLYIASFANPPVSNDIYSRIQALAQMAFGTFQDILTPDMMLAHLIRCQQFSVERVDREISEVKKWFDRFIELHANDQDFIVNQFIYSFCGALKAFQFFALEKNCLEAAEKRIGNLDVELTKRLDYLMRGGGTQNRNAIYYGGSKRNDTLPVDYGAGKMRVSDIEWLFNEARGYNSRIDYALVRHLQIKTVQLPSPQISPQMQSIAAEIQKLLGYDARISQVRVTCLNNNKTFLCLKIRVGRFPNTAFLFDMTKENVKIQFRIALCWIPIAAGLDEQKQQCTALWASGASDEMAYMEKIFEAIENDIQRAVDTWRTAQGKPQVVSSNGGGQIYY